MHARPKLPCTNPSSSPFHAPPMSLTGLPASWITNPTSLVRRFHAERRNGISRFGMGMWAFFLFVSPPCRKLIRPAFKSTCGQRSVRIAVFLAPVTVNGVLKINGEAHFAAGIVSKGDALVLGSLAIGSDDRRGWGVVRELAIQTRLALNGTLVTDRAVQVREAA